MYKFRVSDMSCGHCKARIGNALSANKQIQSFSINLESKIIEVETVLPPETVAGLIDDAGYTAEIIPGI